MRIEVCVIEINPESLSGPQGAIWTEVFDNEIDADEYVQTLDSQEKQFIQNTQIPITYTILGMVYHNDCNVKPMNIQEVSL
jgi:hypothetical protein